MDIGFSEQNLPHHRALTGQPERIGTSVFMFAGISLSASMDFGGREDDEET